MAFALLKPSRHDVYPFIDPREGLKGAAAGKTVVVTGAGSGIGRAIAQAFALAGAREIIIAARRAGPLEETKASVADLAPECKVTVAGNVDISAPESVKNFFDSLPAPPDVLVSNAAVNTSWKPISDLDLDQWKQNIDINLNGTFYMAKGYLSALKAANKTEGRIINVSSNNSWRYIPGLASYATSKIGVNMLCEYIDRENQAAGTKIRCVAMHPGGVLTELGGGPSDEIRKLLIDQPALPGGTAVYLSTERSDYLMGRYVNSTWDMEELEKHREEIEKDENLLRERIVGIM